MTTQKLNYGKKGAWQLKTKNYGKKGAWQLKTASTLQSEENTYRIEVSCIDGNIS